MNLATLCMTIPPDTGVAPGQPAIGDAYAGGFYAGQITISSVLYNLVLSPRASGEVLDQPYKTDGKTYAGNTSVNDGKLIQSNMVATGIDQFPSQKAVMALNIGGFTDWYIPAKEEMEIIYRNFKPTTTANVTTSGTNASSVPPTTTNYTTAAPARTALTDFRSTGTNYLTPDYYYTATQGSSGGLQVHAKRFTTGADSQDLNGYDYPVRAVRRVAA